MQDNLQQRISAAITAMSQHPSTAFYAGMLYKLRIEVKPDIPTACTDCHSFIYIGEEFGNSLGDSKLLTVILHELYHVIYKHSIRRRINLKRWNVACDYAINYDITSAGLGDLILEKCWLYNTAYKGMTADKIYDLLSSNSIEIDLPMEDIDEAEISEEEAEYISQKIDTMIAATAKDVMNKSGILPPSIQRIYNEITESKIDWVTALAEFAGTTKVPADYSYRRPNKLSADVGMILPSIHHVTQSDGMMVAIDVSGSVSQKMLSEFLSECVGIFASINPVEITVVLFDDTITGKTSVSNVEELLAVKYIGGGGTYIEPVLAEYSKGTYSGLVVITDGYFHMPAITIKEPVLWAIYDNPTFTPTCGDVIHFDAGDL